MFWSADCTLTLDITYFPLKVTVFFSVTYISQDEKRNTIKKMYLNRVIKSKTIVKFFRDTNHQCQVQILILLCKQLNQITSNP